MLKNTLTLLMLSVLAFSAKKQIEWKTGKVLDSGTAKTYSSTTAIAVKDTQLLIAGDEFAYTVNDSRAHGGGNGLAGIASRGIANRHRGCRFIVGDDVKYYQEKEVLHVVDVDGKECKTEILRQERLTPRK